MRSGEYARHPWYQQDIGDLPLSYRSELFARTVVQVAERGRIAALLSVADTALFNDPGTLLLLRALHAGRGARLQVVAPPVLLVPQDRSVHNGLIVLAQEGIAAIVYRPFASSISSFWAAEQERVEPEDGDIFHRYETWRLLIAKAQAGQDPRVPLVSTADGWEAMVQEIDDIAYASADVLLQQDAGRGLVMSFAAYDASLATKPRSDTTLLL